MEELYRFALNIYSTVSYEAFIFRSNILEDTKTTAESVPYVASFIKTRLDQILYPHKSILDYSIHLEGDIVMALINVKDVGGYYMQLPVTDTER